MRFVLSKWPHSSPSSLVFPVLLEEVDKGLDFRFVDVRLQELAVVVDQGGHRVLSADVVPDLALHHGEELVRNVFLNTQRKRSVRERRERGRKK